MAANDTPKNADFIQKIVSDAKNPPQTRTLTGWFGDAGKEGFRRLYTDAQLSSYSDIPADAILHSEPVKDSQPPGAVMVWVKADAQLDSSSASSRASRFLQGDLTKELLGEGAAERGGFRCVTQPPCAEPTGFTGLCTKQPDVGGCWPCITAIPHCAEPTGFTGRCTHVPWPLPTHYAGCTVLHCPTFDLTCIPQVCNAIASGIPGCGGGSPIEQGGGPQEKAGAAADAARIPKTELLGCGFTKEWGLCQTQLLHCQPSVNVPCISQGMEPCTKPPFDPLAAQQGGGGQVGAAAGGNIAIRPTLAPTVFICCNPTIFHRPCPTRQIFCTRFGPQCPTQSFECTSFGPQCPPTPGFICTQFGTCGGGGPSAIDACPSSLGCPPGGGGIDPAAGGAAFGAAAPAPAQRQQPLTLACDPLTPLCNPSSFDGCVSRLCATKAPTQICTQIPLACPTQFQQPCPTACGPDCQTQQYQCTHVQCVAAQLVTTVPACTGFTGAPDLCPATLGPNCIVTNVNSGNCARTTVGRGCNAVGAQAVGAGDFPPSIGIACTIPALCPVTVNDPNCQTMNPETCTTVTCTPMGCPVTPLCTQIDCTQMCPGGAQQGGGFGAPQAAAAGPAAANIAIQFTQFISCRSHFAICPSPFCPSPFPFRCPPSPLPLHCPQTVLCPQTVFCPQTPFCPLHTVGGPGCPTGIVCQASPIPQCGGGVSFDACPSIACQQQFPQVQPQQQQQFGAGVTRGMCPTPGTTCCPLMAQAPQQQIGFTNFDCPTPNTFCFVCPPDQFQMQQQGAAALFPNPTPATRCFICPPRTFDFRCGTQAVNTAGPYWCPTWPVYLCRIDI